MPGTLSRRTRTALAGFAAAAALMLAAAPAGAGPTAKASQEELLTIVTDGKLKPRKNIRIQVAVAQTSELTANMTLKLKGPNVFVSFPAVTVIGGTGIEAVAKPNKAARRAINRNPKASRLKVEFTARNLATGEIDIDTETYRFKR